MHISSVDLPLKPGRVAVIALYLFYLATVGRILIRLIGNLHYTRLISFGLLGLELVYLLLFTLVIWRPGIIRTWLHLYFITQSAILLVPFALVPDIDFITAPFTLLSYQIALLFTGRTRWAWIIAFVLLTGGSSILFLGLLKGLSLGLLPMASEIVLTALVLSNQEIEAEKAMSQVMVTELQQTHRKLELYAEQVEELAAIEERNRLARDLHDSVSQTIFSIILNTRATQLLLEKDPVRIRAQLEQLQKLVQSALADMRSLITQLRVKGD